MNVVDILLPQGEPTELPTIEPGERRAPPKAINVILPVWGYPFVRQFLEVGLPTLLAPGNLPTLAKALPCTFTLMTSEEDAEFVREHPAFHRLSSICPTEIRLMDHLITGSNYSTTLTLAYTEMVRAAGPAMLDTCFFFLVSDYIFADGSLANVLARLLQGASGVLVGNFQVVQEDARIWLVEQLNASPHVLSLPPRPMMHWALAHLHPATIANTVNYPLSHNIHTNRLFWRVDADTLIGRFYLMHMLVIRPETTQFTIGASCDYSFVPEMCPSGAVEVITDSDDYLVIEMQPREHESNFLRVGPLRPKAVAKTLSQWTTARHRENANFSVIFHGSELSSRVAATRVEADSFIAEVGTRLRKTPQPHRGHRYWRGAIAAFNDATGQRLSADEWHDVLNTSSVLPSDLLVQYLRFTLFGQTTRVRPWHPRWPDYRLISQRIEAVLADRNKRVLLA
ncbi:MAG TPA: hypothetical protein VIG52_10565, partial [Methyloceanibacter sp.]